MHSYLPAVYNIYRYSLFFILVEIVYIRTKGTFASFLYKSEDALIFPSHPLLVDFLTEIDKCENSASYCNKYESNISNLASKLANDHSLIYMERTVISLFEQGIVINELELYINAIANL